MDHLLSHLGSHEFKTLFIEDLGWDHASGKVSVDADALAFRCEAIAQKRGLQVFQCEADKYTLFNRRRLQTVQRQLLKLAHEHIIIYFCASPRKQVWQWALYLPDGRRLRHREHPFFSSSPPEPLLTRLSRLRFTLEEEDRVTLLDALGRIRAALDTESDLSLFVNKPWYAEQSDRLALAMRAGGVEQFRDFVSFHHPMAKWGASEWRRYLFGLDAEDGEQIAAIGLLEAARRFEPSHGFQFSTYAYHWIRQACQRYGPDCANFIRIPPHALGQCRSLRAHLNRIATQSGDDAVTATLEELRQQSPKLYAYWRRYVIATAVRSLSDAREPEFAAARSLNDPGDPPDANLSKEALTEELDGAIATLSSDDARMVRLRYGFDGDDMTLEQIAQVFGLTRERIRQRLERSEDTMRLALGQTLGGDICGVWARQRADESGDRSDASTDAKSSAQLAVLSQINGHATGVGAVEIAARCGLDRSTRKAALRSLLQQGRIAQCGRGRRATYRANETPSGAMNGDTTHAH